MSVQIIIGDGLIEEKPIPIEDNKTVFVKYNDPFLGDKDDYGRNLAPTRTIFIKDGFGNVIFENTEDNPYYWGENKIIQTIKDMHQEMIDEAEGIQL